MGTTAQKGHGDSGRSPGGQFVLENQMGQVVRAFHIEAPRFALVYREDTGRIESNLDPKELEDEGIEHTVLAEVDRAELMKKEIRIGEAGTLRFVPEIVKLAPRHALAPESDEFKTILKRAGAVNLALLLFCLLINAFFPAVPEIEPVVVTIDIPPPKLEKKPVPKPPRVVKQATVRPSERKIERKRVARVTPKPVKRQVRQVKPKVVRHHKPTSHGRSRSSQKVAKGGVNINQLGALKALGSVSNAPNTGGTLNLSHVTAKLGSGGGGTGRAGNGGLGASGTGGFSNALGGKGLAAASRGSGGGIGLPSGGYGTRGRAGGHNGYGRTNLAGSGDGYFQPLEQDAEAEGGLDMDQISEVIERNRGQIQYCYEQGLQVKPLLSGRVGVKFTINGGGRVSVAGIANSSMRSGQVEGCILRKLKGFRFPHPVGGVNVRVNYPFQFQRVSQR